MSGIEAAGLILGLWPIISSLVVTYRDARAGEALTKLAMEVKVHESIYKGWLRNLLQGHDQLTDIQIQTLMEPTADAAWQKSDIQQHLREILPHDTFESIDFALSEIHEAMKILERILRKGDVDVVCIGSRRRPCQLTDLLVVQRIVSHHAQEEDQGDIPPRHGDDSTV